MSAGEEIVASGSRGRRPERGDETYRADPQGTRTAQRSNRAARRSDSQALQVAVIGAGVAGLVCALRLAEAGAKVAVFERAPRLDAGTSCLSAEILPLWGASLHLFACARRLGLSPRRLRTIAPTWSVAGAGTVILRTRWSGLEVWVEPEGMLSGAARRAAGRALRRLLRAGRHGASTLPDVPLAQAALPWGGEEGLRLLWRPLCRLLCLTAAEETPLPRLARLLAAALGTRLQRQWVQLPDSFVEWFSVPLTRTLGHCGSEVAIAAPVHTLEPCDGGWRLPQTDGRRFDHVVLAVAPWDAAVLLREIQGLGALRHRLSNWPKTSLWSTILSCPSGEWRFTPAADAWCAPAGGARTGWASLDRPSVERLAPLGTAAIEEPWHDFLLPLPESSSLTPDIAPGLWLAGGWLAPAPTFVGPEASAASGWHTAGAILNAEMVAG
ncbi:FAD-dependent oxidoreductase [Tepidiphilus baoligensis]|uniref:FAD-dependent oxidoreductase n=2 Tax=Tepidiphilus baoligensis TaxID=2698687 RepID=A0ABX1QIX0_9PROT|nr:FAD-dependent oxidoreductase [Tepidiphilus baoligensis]